MNYVVYEHVAPNGKRYIGMTSQIPQQRWGNGKNYHNKRFNEDISKFGWDKFQHNIISKKISKEEAEILEKELIKKFDTMNPEKGYNVAKGGNVRDNFPLEERIKRSEACKKHWREVGGFSEEHIKNLSEAHKGTPSKRKGTHLSQETKDKISAKNKGRTYSKEQRLMLRKASTQKKKVRCIDTGKIYSCLGEAGEDTNSNSNLISQCCRGIRLRANGMRWEYV